jgi:uroporphyrinogen decarboxylase
MPIASFPGAQLTGATVWQMASDSAAQTEAVLALHERFRTRVLLTCMDLSAEAEAFGATLQTSDDEVPTVRGRQVSSEEDAARLPVPDVGTARTAVQPEVVCRLVAHAPGTPVLAGVTGPFSLAARLLGVSEALLLTHDRPDLVHTVTEKCAAFLTRYVIALRDAGAQGVFMAEPTAGLISPQALAQFSAPYVRAIAGATAAPGFTVLLHNCGAKPAHLPALLTSGVRALHFGAPMDLTAALAAAPPDTLVFGNLDPAGVFLTGTPESVAEHVRQRLAQVGHHPNFVLSSGCDLPCRTPLANLAAFFAATSDNGVTHCLRRP